MREILFRGLHRRKGEKVRLDGTPVESIWVYGGYCQYNVERGIIYQVEPEVNKYPVYADSVGQYTGLTDKNGVKIFEGDIVAWRDENFVLNGHYTYGFYGYKYGDELIVRCLKSGFMLCKKHDGMMDIPNANSKIDNYAFWNYHRFFEVIGNIHDNPELLEKKET